MKQLGGGYATLPAPERKEQYRKYTTQLIESGALYYALDTPEELAAQREKPVHQISNATAGAMQMKTAHLYRVKRWNGRYRKVQQVIR